MRRQERQGRQGKKGRQVRKNSISKECSAVPGETARAGRARKGTVAVAARVYIASERVNHHHNIIIVTR